MMNILNNSPCYLFISSNIDVFRLMYFYIKHNSFYQRNTFEAYLMIRVWVKRFIELYFHIYRSFNIKRNRCYDILSNRYHFYFILLYYISLKYLYIKLSSYRLFL